jgi:hypothetical protein
MHRQAPVRSQLFAHHNNSTSAVPATIKLMATSTNGPLQSRPYRSHRVPACIRCRSRKIRCHIDIPGEPCLSCRERRLKCQYVEHSENTPPSDSGAAKKRRLSGEGDEHVGRPRSAPVLHKPSTHPSASIILAPHVAEDVDILQRHISQHQSASGDGGGGTTQDSETYKTLSRDTRNPIIYLTVPRFRTGLAPRVGAGTEHLEIISQLVGVFHREVVDLYLAHVHPSFPVLDDETCEVLRTGSYETLSKSLMCVVLAIGTPFWRRSDVLKMHPRPDTHYIWNKVARTPLAPYGVLDGMITLCTGHNCNSRRLPQS